MTTIESKEKSKLLSSTIDFLRFPLIMMVIFIHMSPKTINLVDAKFSILSAKGLLNLIEILFSHVITSVTVPTFFVISGFLFFNNFHEWSWEGYKKKMSNRVKTLLIPYIIWNLIPFILYIASIYRSDIKAGNSTSYLKTFFFEKIWHVFYDFNLWESSKTDWLGNQLSSSAPFDVPLWYIRDLFVVSLLTPLIYFAIKRLKIGVVIVLFFAYISKIWTQLPGLDIESVFFFTTGAYFAINKLNIVEFVHKYKYIILPTSLILLVVCTIYDAGRTDIGHNIIPFYVCTGVLTAFFIASTCISKYNMKPNKLLTSACFFIFAFHEVPLPFIDCLLNYVQNIIHSIIPGHSISENSFCYITAPFITAAICILIFMILKKIAPRVVKVICGNR